MHTLTTSAKYSRTIQAYNKFRSGAVYNRDGTPCLNTEMEFKDGMAHFHWDERKSGGAVPAYVTLKGNNNVSFRLLQVRNKSDNGEFVRIHAVGYI